MALTGGPGDEVLLLRALTGTEELGRLFEYTVECVSESPDVVFEDWLGQNVSIRLASHGGERERFLNGIVNDMEQTGMIGRLASYRLKVVPFLWLLTRKADCRIFQDQTVPEIILEMMKEKGYTYIDNRLSRTYSKWEYCVQYRETDLNFIHRLMEQEGIYYYFIHEEGKHTLVLSDDRGSHSPEEGAAEVPFFPPGARAVSRPHVYQWRVRKQIQSTAYSTTDYNFQKPKDDLYVRGSKPKQHTFGEIEVFDYPGGYTEYADGETHVRLRTEELEVGYETIDAMTSSRLVCTGRLFTLTGHPRSDQGREYLLVGTTLEATTDAFDGGSVDTQANYTFRCGFDCIPSATPYRRSCSTPKPVIPGPQTAFVTGLEGQEITTDEHARVKVKFHWDLYGEANEKSTCWIRVSQDFAGKRWGSLFVPRQGQEVIVTFLEGDPDRPLITGRVYNAENKPPYDPKANPTFSTIKTQTIDGDGFNELRFDDKAGEEQIFMHAQKELDIRVLGSERETVCGEFHLSVGGDHKRGVGGDMDSDTKGSEKRNVGADLHLTVDAARMVKIAASDDLTVGANLTESVTGDHVEDAARWLVRTRQAKIEASESIVLRCGGSKIKILPGRIQLTSELVEISGKSLVHIDGQNVIVQASGNLLNSAGSISLSTPEVNSIASVVSFSSAVLMTATLVASAAVVSPSYTPGAGNIL